MTDPSPIRKSAPDERESLARPRRAPAIEDYGVIGDCRSAALVSRSGSIDWLCLPDFSSPSLFAAMLDPEAGGRFAIRPVGPFETTRQYVGETPVLETLFATRSGTARLTDAMILGESGDLQPAREVLRIIEGLDGEVPFELLFDPRPDYGRTRVAVRKQGNCALTCSSGNEHLLLRSDVPLDVAPGGADGAARFAIHAGERLCFSLSYVNRDIAVILPMGDLAAQRMHRTLDWWRDWAGGCTYHGPYRDAVIRSAVTLKLMTFALSGAVVAAPTSSLPEAIGGERNWDYRYCWLRDAALTMRAFLGLGLIEEAGAFLRWLLHATALTQPALNIMYDIYGRTNLTEEELDHLRGYRESRPVRVGNGAYDQVQLDVYGGVISAAADYSMAGGALQRDQLDLLAGFGRTICKQWREPDHGIWELRGEKQHYTFSKLMCWLGLECLLRLSGSQPLKIDRRAVERERDAIRETIEARGYCDQPGSYVGVLDGEWLDSSLLLMASLGYADAGDPRMRSTLDAVMERLGRNGLIYRYEHGIDGFASREGAFGICSFWAVENLAMRGELDRADGLFRRLLGHANDVGLFSEEIDPDTGALLGNFPQAFTHVGLINSALALAKAGRDDRP